MKSLVKVTESMVKMQKIYYLQCSYCGREITGNTPEEVVLKAREWKYDYSEDFVYCSDCLLELK